MALRDFKQYVGKTLAQYLEMKNDLARDQGLPIEMTIVRLFDIPADVAAKLADDYGKKAFNYFARLMPNNVHAELSEDEAFQSLPEDCQASVENYVHGFEQYAHKVYRPDVFSDPSQPAFIIDLDAENDDAFTA